MNYTSTSCYFIKKLWFNNSMHKICEWPSHALAAFLSRYREVHGLSKDNALSLSKTSVLIYRWKFSWKTKLWCPRWYIKKRRSWPNNVGFLAFFERNRGNAKIISITIRILHVYIKYFIDFERFETVAE